MIVETLDHINIRTSDLAGTVRFFVDVLEMGHQPPPGMTDESRGSWLLDREQRAVIHVGTPDAAYPSDADYPFVSGPSQGALHHVAFRCTGFDALRARIDRLGYRFSESFFESIGLRQLFVEEGNGILLELNFFE